MSLALIIRIELLSPFTLTKKRRKDMASELERKLLERWSGFHPYEQRVIINRFLDQCKRMPDRQQWYSFLAKELEDEEQYNRLMVS